MKAVIVLAALAGLSGCAAKTHGPMPSGNGTEAHVVECNGAFQEWTQCYDKAAELCGPYFYTSNEQSGARPFGGAFIFGSLQERSMVVECMPSFNMSSMYEMQKQAMSQIQKAALK